MHFRIDVPISSLDRLGGTGAAAASALRPRTGPGLLLFATAAAVARGGLRLVLRLLFVHLLLQPLERFWVRLGVPFRLVDNVLRLVRDRLILRVLDSKRVG